MAEKVYLAVDLGAESGRVMAGLWNGRKIRLEEIHRFPNGPVALGGTLRWDVLRLCSTTPPMFAFSEKDAELGHLSPKNHSLKGNGTTCEQRRQ